jgi:phenylpropionate dioxygenase-like ring-hydroxylating dioxygenase large terminal subunit
MLSKEDNELATNTNQGTPMGELFRRFWLPVALSEELPGPDCAPIKIQVLGEKLVAIRDTSGRPGVFDAFCPHRGAPLFFGRNEENGLRCVYHGWKFDVDGTCVDLPSAQEGESFKTKIHIKAYPCQEVAGMVFAYMGPPDKQPPFPAFEWTNLPKSHTYVNKFRLECNYLQAMEGDYDPSHGGFLHSTLQDVRTPNPLMPSGRNNFQVQPGRTALNAPVPADEPFPFAVGNRRVTPAFQAGIDSLEDTVAAVLTVNSQELPDGRKQASVGATWMMPIYCTAGIAGPNTYSSNMRIPIDNESLMFYRLRWSYEPIPANHIEEYKHGEYFYPALIPGTWQTRDNIHNDYNIDRVAQRNFSYTGIKTFPLQDIALIEGQWGPIAERELEHLTSMDYVIIKVRRRLLAAARAMAQGIEPEAPWHPEQYRWHREIVTVENGTIDDAVEQAKTAASTSKVAPEHLMAPEIAARAH